MPDDIEVLRALAARKAALPPMAPRSSSIRRPGALRVATMLAALVVVATAVALPFALHYAFLFPRSTAIPALAISSVLAIVAAYAGTPIARRSGLDGRLFAYVGRRAITRLGAVLLIALGTGFGWALLIVFLNWSAFLRDPREYPGSEAALVGEFIHVGVVEEIVFRWLLLSTIVVCLAWIVRRPVGAIGGWFFVANLVTAALFASTHLDIYDAGFNVGGFLSRFAAGLLLGTLYRRVGLDAAIATHAAIDIFLVVTFSIPTGFVGGR
jgi:hypothetical protein